MAHLLGSGVVVERLVVVELELRTAGTTFPPLVAWLLASAPG